MYLRLLPGEYERHDYDENGFERSARMKIKDAAGGLYICNWM
jgi:hypothetical protein